MPSEAQSQEPRDRGPPPPVTRAGRSAQLAKAAAAATSSTLEKRPRGRPRKDGSSGRSLPPPPPPPPSPPPPPPPKSRKKGRSRGRAQVEDEESMDATEKIPPQKTEENEERTTGRRRSTSRKKSNTNPIPEPDPDPDPKPNQERLSPPPELDPPPPPSNPLVETAPSAEGEDQSRLAPQLSASSPVEEPRVSPLPPSPSHSHQPALDAGEEDSPRPTHSPAPMEVDCSSGPVVMEMEGAEASPAASSPMEQSPGLSPCSSPLVSPCPRLEDEDSLSSLFQRSLSEDSGGSPTPSLGHTKKRLKLCAFCYCGEESPLGQGRLVVFGPTPGYIPLHILNRRASSDRDNDCHDHCYRGDQALPMCGSPEQCESSSEFVEQFGPIGLPHDINVQSLFDPTGQCCAHLQCAAWSEGVCRGEGQSLLYVDKAIDSGSTQVCAFCRQLGASLCCRETGCGRSYHFPCAAAAGAHQDWDQRHTWCTRHTETGSSQCVLCSSGSDVSNLLMCSCCGNCYHGSCLNPPLTPSPLCRAGWQCHWCRVCQSCRLRDDVGALLVCERCDKAYHTHCLKPPLDQAPSAGWSCKNCKICRRCGVRSSGQWANHPFLCESCDPALPCPLCDHVPNLYTPQEYLTCTCCYRCVHTECIVQAGEGRAGSEAYICSTCRPQEEIKISVTPIPQSSTPTPTQAPPSTILMSPVTNPTEASPVSPTTHSQVQLVCSEPPQSPSKTICTSLQQSLTPSNSDLMELQQSPSQCHPDPRDLQQCPASCHPDPMALQQSPAQSPPDDTELQQSPAPIPPDDTELQQSPAPSPPDVTGLQQSPAPSPPDATGLQQSPAPSPPDATGLQQSPAPSPPDATELQQSPAPLHLDATELQQSPAPLHLDATELQQSPAPLHLDATELQQSPAPRHLDSTELQQSPAPRPLDSTELQQSPAPRPLDPTELQQSPAPRPLDPTELQQSPAPRPLDPTELQQSPAPRPLDPTELQQSPAPRPLDPTELQQSPAPRPLDPTELQQSSAPSSLDPTELQQSPAPTPTSPSPPSPTELQKSPAPQHLNPTELQGSPAPPPPDPMEVQGSPAPPPPDPMEVQGSPAPPPPDPTELQGSPAPPHLDPSELQNSPTPSVPDPSELQNSPAPSVPDPSELQNSPAPSVPDPSELQNSPAPSVPDPSELQNSPAPSVPDPTELQFSPAPSVPDPSELQNSPAPSVPDPTELQLSPAPSAPDPTELQQSPVPSHPDPSKVKNSPSPSPADPTELHQSSSPSHPDSKELHQSPAQSHPDSIELQQSLASSLPDPTTIKQSPVPSSRSQPDPTELQQSPTQSQFDPVDLHRNPAQSHPDLTEVQTSSLPSHLDPPELRQSPTQDHPDATELQQRLAPSHPGYTELQKSPLFIHVDPAGLQQNPPPSPSDPKESLQIPKSPFFNQAELQQSPLSSHRGTGELGTRPFNHDKTGHQKSLQSSHPSPAALQKSPASFNHDSTDNQKSYPQSHHRITEVQQSPTQSLVFKPTELQKRITSSPIFSAELPQSPTLVTSTQAQHRPHLLSSSLSSITLNSTEGQLVASEHQQSPLQDILMDCGPAHSPHSHPTNSPTQVGLSPSMAQSFPAEPPSPPPHSPVQHIVIRFDRQPSPTNFPQPQHSPTRTGQHSPLLHSHAQVCTSPPQSHTQDADSTLDQKNPGHGTAWDISTLDHGLSKIYCMSPKKARRHALRRPISAPCSPSFPHKPTQCSLSQPASPVQSPSTQPVRTFQLSLFSSQLDTQSRVTEECIKTSTTEMKSLEHRLIQPNSNPDGQTLESSPVFQRSPSKVATLSPNSQLPNQFVSFLSSTLCPNQSGPMHVPAITKPESLIHISTSAEHSSLAFSTCAEMVENLPAASYIDQSPSESPSRCRETTESKTSPVHIQASAASVSPKHASEMPSSPAGFIRVCSSPMPMETTPDYHSTVAADTTPTSPPASPVTVKPSTYAQPVIQSLASPLSSSVQPASPSAGLTRPIQPKSCQDEEMVETVGHLSHLLNSEASTSYCTSTIGSAVHTSSVLAGQDNTEGKKGCSLMDSHAQEKSSPSVCSIAELTQTQTCQSTTDPGQSSPPHVQTICSSPQASPLPTPANLSPLHCRSTSTSPASSTVGHSLSNITSDHSSQTGPHSSSKTDVGIIHSPPRSSPAGQTSPVHIQSTSSSAHAGPLQTEAPSLANTSYSSPAHTSGDFFSPHHRSAQASETYHSPTCSPKNSLAPNTGTSSGLTVEESSPTLGSSSLDVDMAASTTVESTAHSKTVNPSTSLVKLSDSIKQTSPTPLGPLSDELSAISPTNASLGQVGKSPANPHRSADESQQSTALASLLDKRTATPVDVTLTQASPSHASSSHSSSTQDHTAMPSTSHTSETPASRPPSVLSQVSPPQAFSADAPQHISVCSSSVASPVSGPVGSGYTQITWNPDPTSPVQPEASLNLSPTSPMRCGASPGADPVCPALAIIVQPENSPSLDPASYVRSDAGPGSYTDSTPQENQQTEECEATVDMCKSEKQGELVKYRKTDEQEEIEREALKLEEMDEPHHTTIENPDKERVEWTGGGVEQDQEKEKEDDQQSNSNCVSSGVQQHHQSPPHTGVASPQPTTPHSALLPHQPSPQCPPLPPSRAGSLEASPSSSLHMTALPPSCSPHTPLEVQLEVNERTDRKKAEATSEDGDSQSQSQFEVVDEETQSTKDKNQSHADPSERQEEGATERMSEEELKEAREGVQHEGHSDMEAKALVSPVLELDPSLDMEVMQLMTSSSPPPSFLQLSTPSPPLSRRGKGRSLRPPPCSSRPSDDLSIRLRQSPFSTEASPETSPTRAPITPPPLSPPSPALRCSPASGESPPLYKPQAPPSTVLPLTPKIGMGKPAITKRKFSPGRARVKQGSWWSNRRAVSPPSSSQDSTGEGGWDSPKPRPPDSPLWSMRVGRGSGFPGRRRSRGGGIGGGRGGRGRSRMKTAVTVSPGCGYMEPFQPKEEEENSMHNTVVMFSTSDHFTLRQDMCVVCGSFGQGAEGRLLACSQCGQCYHPYCVNVKITRVVLTKGWRCLECTVCEACGAASDPGRLLLCDDCDISYHTYCLDPPLHTVPKGAWKCKWCVWCVQCGSTSPGLHCEWQSNYSRCGPCASLSRCPLCQRQYSHDDLILQCQQCDRWVHAVCQGLTTEDEVELAADEGFDCSLCRTQGRGSYGSSDSFDSPYMPQIISRTRELDTKTYTQDGVCLTESGLSHLQSLVEPLTSPRRYRRCKPKLKLRIINQNSVSVLQTPPDPDLHTDQYHSRDDLDCEMKSDSSPERDHTHNDYVTKEPEVTDGNKKRKRKPYRPGIGGFTVRQRGAKAGPGRIGLCRKDSAELLLGQDEGLLEADIETAPPANQVMEKVKKRYRKKKTKLEEAFPSYLQEAFFGRELLDRSRQGDRMAGPQTLGPSQSVATTSDIKCPVPGLHDPSSRLPVGAIATSKKTATLPMSEEALVDLSDVLNTDPHILATGHTGQFQVERSPSPFAGLDIGSVAGHPSLTSDPTGSGGQCQRVVQEEPLDAILSPELDKMVTDGAILSKLYKIPELEGKDVEEVFTAVLSPNDNQQPELSQQTLTAAGTKTPTQHTAGLFPRLPLMNGLMGAAPHFPRAPMMSSSVQGPTGFRLPPPETSNLVPVPSPASANPVPAGESEQEVMSTAQRGMLKWEKEETLGELATVAPVLYCNTNFPQLREQYPDWSTRVKQIAKLWRKASSQERAPYVQKARDNRAAQRINKVQLNEPLKRHLPSQQQPQQQPPQLPTPGPYDPVSMETEMTFRDPLKPKESEQEQEWKLRQGEGNDRWGAGKKRQESLPQSKALKSPTHKDCPYQASVAGGGKEALQMRQKSKQLAKMEATQKLEQVKNEQLQQQRQQQLLANQRLAGPLSPETGSRSPMTPTQQLGTGDSSSPLHPPASRETRQQLLLQGNSGLADDVFLRPQAPPPSNFSSLPQSPHPSSPLHQPPTSPQMFSPPSSRPSSPWDPYSKVAVTPRPTSLQSVGTSSSQQQRRNSLSTSPAHDVFGSPVPSPDSKTSDVSRVLGPQSGLQQSRPGMMSLPSGSAPDVPARHTGIRAPENYQRTHNMGNLRAAVPGELLQGGVFKAPMPPQHQPQQDVFCSTGGGGRRDPSRPTDLGFALAQPQDSPFPSSPLSGLGSPHRSPYAQTPGTPRPDYSQQITDPFPQQSPMSSRPSPDPYTNPQTPGTPRPHSDPTYPPTPPALRLDQYNQQSANRRPSPSHPTLDPYASNPGTPRSSLSERFPRSPGSQRSTDPYAQPVGTPRPTPDPYLQQPSTPRPQTASESFTQAPGESFPLHPAASGLSPLASGLSAETGTFTGTQHQLQQSPGRQQQDSFNRTASSQTPKHPGMSEDVCFSALASETPGHDPFEQGHLISGPSQTDKSTTNEMAALAMASLDGPMSMLPQIGDSEEKLKQRQRLRQLILRQQQQKSALRQEKGLHESAAPPTVPPAAPGSGTPRHWSQEDNSTTTAAPTDPFGRPPPPYPGTVRPAGPTVAPTPRFPGGFPGEHRRSFNPSEASFPRQSFPKDVGVQALTPRFSAPPGAPTGLQDSLRPPQGLVPGSGLSAVEGISVQMRRPGEYTGIRQLMTPNTHPQMMPGVPQPFLPRSLPIQQHSIMGQPYIELRHRAPESRMRLPFTLPSASDPEAHLLQPRDPQPSLGRSGLGTRQGEMLLGQQMMAGSVEQLNSQDLGHTAALTQSSEATLPGTDGIEEHLEGEDSAVKDLEDVEVKDLVDLNLNLDPEDGKEDLDLGANDLHLDDFLLSGKFDLIAYADPELNLEGSEELDLGEPVEEREGGEKRDGASGSRKTDSQTHLVGQVKQELKDSFKTEPRDGLAIPQHPAPQHEFVTAIRPPGTQSAGSSLPSSSVHFTKDKLENSVSNAATLPVLQGQEQGPSSSTINRVNSLMAAGPQSVFQQQQTPFGTSPSPSPLLTPHPQGLPVSTHPSMTPQDPPAPPHQLALQPSQSCLPLNPQIQLTQPGTSTQNQAVFSQNKPRPLLLEEQPLLLQDLLDQERQEQQQQKQMQALIRQKSTPDSVFPNMEDFDSISDPIMKAKMVALKGINKVMTQNNLGLNPMGINRIQQAPGTPETSGGLVAPGPEGTTQPSQLVAQDAKINPQLVRPNPPNFSPGFVNESQRHQYEEWLVKTQELLQMQQHLLEDQIAAHRKTKKALSAKQRTAKKAGRPFADEDATQLRNITEQQGAVQKQLEQIRKQQKDHAELIEDYRTKQQKQRAQQQQQQPAASPIVSAVAPPIPQTLLPQPMMPMQPHPGSSTPVRVPNVPPGWTPSGGVPGVMGQRMPPHLPPQMLPTLPNAPQAAAHTQTPPAMVTGLPAQTSCFPGGANGAAGDGATPTPQVKFDDNNPFSEGFQERERRERLREQQERQRVQLMQEVERHRALQQRLELEQQGRLGASRGPEAGIAAGALPGSQIVQITGSAPAPAGDSLSQMPFFSSELPQDFLQSPPAPRHPPQPQPGPPFPQQGFTGPLHSAVHRPLTDVASSNLQTRLRFPGPVGPSAQGLVRPAGIAAGMTPSHSGGHRFGHDSSSSSPSTPLPPSFPCTSTGAPPSLMQLYSDIIPDDKPKKKRSRKKDGDDSVGGGGARTPLSSHSDDLTAPPTPAFSDTSCSTPTRGSVDQTDALFSQSSGLAPSSELERQLSVSAADQQSASVLGMESQRGPLFASHLDVKLEREEGGACAVGVKMEEDGGEGLSSPSPGDAGKELLRQLLKDKTSPANTPSPTPQAMLAARRHLSSDSVRSEEENRPGSHGNVVSTDNPSLEPLDSFSRKKTQRCKRPVRPDKDRAPSKYKRRKKEEEEKTLHSSNTSASSDQLVTHLRQLSVLPLMEPVLEVDLSLFPPYGSSSLGRDSKLTGSFGNACLDGVSDYYSQLIYKQNNLSNPPTPPASLPPTPPPVARQKLLNGFATTEELARKELTDQDGVSGLKQKGDEILDLNHTSKTVDVPASLPTPPHNNQEELRVQDSSERNSPDGFIPSSSPESVVDVEISRYPDLSFIKLEPPSPCPSPTITMMPCAWGKGSAVKQEVKAEPSHQGPPSCSSTDLVTIAITLNPVAAQNVAGVMAAVAALLRVPGPVNYQLSRPAGPEQSSLALLAGVRVPLTQGSAGSRQQRLPPAAANTAVRMNYIQHGGPAAARSQCCSYCKVLLGNGVRIVKELKQEGQSRPGSSLVFCSPNCSALYMSELQSRSTGNKSAVPLLVSESDHPFPSKVQHQYTSNMSSIAVHSLPLTSTSLPPSASSPSPPLSFPTASAITMETKPCMDSLKVKVKLRPHPRAVPGGEDSPWHGKRLKSSRWRRWSVSITLSRGPCIPNEAVAMPTEEEIDVLLKKLGACLQHDPLPKDQRRCCFCHQQGDGLTDGPARLLNLDLDLWVHLNCALWSSEVYETQAGALINVELALRRGLTLRCAYCQQTGATTGCNRLRCTNTYHFTCALQAHCTFFKDKTMLCHLHKPRTVPLSGDRSSSGSPSSTPGLTPDLVAVASSDPYDSELRCFAVFRRVFVQRDEARQIAAIVQRGEQQHTFRVGSLLFCAVGRLLPHQVNAFHNKTAIFPVGYHANRIYWSMRYSNRRCKYMCYIEEREGEPLFKVKVVEKGHDDVIFSGPTPKAVWDQILEPVSQMRASSGTLKLFPVYLKGEDLFGLTTSAVARITESLPGVEACERYAFRYGRNPLMEWPLAFNPSGSARTEPKACQAKRPYLLTSIAPRCQGSVGSIVGLVPGVIALSPGETVAGAHQGRHSKSSQYRRMKAEWKSNVYLARSRIQGLGLYAARDIEKCTMVIEYIGTIIRSEVANRKERLYESQNRGVYMFRIDNDYVIDATITGGPARYINHSCAPNCITEVVSVEKENKIIISSCRRIQRGEELCYDYKFDLEDDQHKIPCHCGAVNCRKWMN